MQELDILIIDTEMLSPMFQRNWIYNLINVFTANGNIRGSTAIIFVCETQYQR